MNRPVKVDPSSVPPAQDSLVEQTLAAARRAIAIALSGAALGGALLTAGLDWTDRTWLDPRQQALATRHARALQLSETLKADDAALTSVARMAATTGELHWMEEVDRHIPLLTAGANQALALVPPGDAPALARRIEQAQTRLTDLREAAIEATTVSAPEAARRIFESERFRRDTEAFSAVVNDLADAVLTDAQRQRAELRRDRTLVAMGSLAVALLLGAALWRWLSGKLWRTGDGLRASEAHMQRLARTDLLTGLPNRASFLGELERALGRDDRAGQGLTLLIFDLDRFKPVNDTHGHHVGDRVLVQVARRLENVLRDDEPRARYGGDEFVVLLHGPDARQAGRAVAERLIEALSRPMTVQAADGSTLQLEIGASIGMACFPQDGEDADTLLREADDALYRAKRLGRGQLCAVEPRRPPVGGSGPRDLSDPAGPADDRRA